MKVVEREMNNSEEEFGIAGFKDKVKHVGRSDE